MRLLQVPLGDRGEAGERAVEAELGREVQLHAGAEGEGLQEQGPQEEGRRGQPGVALDMSVLSQWELRAGHTLPITQSRDDGVYKLGRRLTHSPPPQPAPRTTPSRSPPR